MQTLTPQQHQARFLANLRSNVHEMPTARLWSLLREVSETAEQYMLEGGQPDYSLARAKVVMRELNSRVTHRA